MVEEQKKLSIEVSKDCWKKLKIISIDKDVGINKYIRDLLEKHVNKKSNLPEDAA